MKNGEKLKVVQKLVGDITPYEQNPRHNDEAVDAVAASIEAFGFQQPIVVDTDGVIIAGHTRYKAAKQLGLETVPVVVAELTEEEARAYRLADNKTGELATWDFDLLDIELDGIGMDMSQFGFVEAEPPEEIEITVDEFTEEVEPKTKEGDIWQLGKHRLICGDATEEETILKLMDGEMVDLMITDPPYNVALGQKPDGTPIPQSEAMERHRRTDGLMVMNDNWMGDDQGFIDFLIASFRAALNVMKGGAAFYIWHADSQGFNFRTACNECGMQVRSTLIWNKNSFTLGRADYQWKHEPCLYGWTDGTHYFVDDRKQATVIEDTPPDFSKMKKEDMKRLLEEIYSDKISTTVMNEDKPLINDLHPTMKPLKLMARLIRNSSKQGWAVLDMFGGSGSTLIACEQMDRRCFMCELDPHYCDVIINRWEQLTGEKAELIIQA